MKKNQINIQYHKTKYLYFVLGSFDGKLCLLDFKDRKARTTLDAKLKKAFDAEYVEQDDEVLRETRKQLDEYFNLERKDFDIPIIASGTDFQKSVWSALLRVPYATTSTYLQIAKDINNEKAVRAVANANGANPIAIIIPCHRIIGSNGKLTGYTGGLSIKKSLLELELNSK